MSKTLEKADELGAQSLQLIKDFTEKGIDFVQQQAPLLCDELVKRELARCAMVSACCLIAVVVLLKASLVLREKYKGMRVCGDRDLFFMVSVILATSSTIPLVILFDKITDLLSVWVAPRAFLFDYFTRLCG